MKKYLIFNLLVMLTVIEGLLAYITTVSLPTNTTKPFLFGLSWNRLALLLFILSCILGLLVVLYFRKKFLCLLENHFNSSRANKVVTAVGVTSFLLLWVTIFTPTKILYDLEGLFVRSKPALIWLELFLLQSVLWIKFSKNTFDFSPKNAVVNRKSLTVVFLPLLLLWVIISITKVGLVKDTAYWNVPGIPLSMIQFLGILLFLFLGLIFAPQERDQPPSWPKLVNILIPICIYLVAVLIWGSTPMQKHFFSLTPTLPNLQPYPYSDARLHDLGGVSVLMGKGIYFHNYTDKPLYMVFLAILHIFAGNDYSLLQWAQIFVLAFIPVLLYLFGKRYFGTLFGIVIAAMVVVQQCNAIALSYKVASVNPKLLMSEVLMLLGIVLTTYLLFQWMKSPELKKVFQLGGLIGALSLVRINPIFIAPVIAFIIIVKFWKYPKLLIKQIALLSTGFVLVFSPWLFIGVNAEGQSWFFLKIRDVIENRYQLQTELAPQQRSTIEYTSVLPRVSLTSQNTNSSISFRQEVKLSSSFLADDKTYDLAWIMFNHFLHNFSTSLLILPDSITVSNLSDLSAREYWQDENRWDGNFPPGQYILILANLFIVSLGISYGWKKYRWAGLAPLIVFLAYDLSLSAATNSGSRYIVPISWIIFFYYALGLILTGRFLLGFLGIEFSSESSIDTANEAEVSKAPIKSWLRAVTPLVMLALLLPVTNLVVPKLVNSDHDYSRLLEYARSKEPPEYQLISGTILYPYYQEIGSISFDFLEDTKITSYQISQSHLASPHEIVYESGVPALMSVTYNDGMLEIKSIYLQNNDSPQLFWRRD